MGTRNFKSHYLVATKVFLEEDLELTLGYGWQRIRGFFGGALWIPFRQSHLACLSPLALAAEYDATPYHREEIEKHPKGRVKKSPINFGVKYKLWEFMDLSVSYVRGCKVAASASMTYNFGHTTDSSPKQMTLCPISPRKTLNPSAPGGRKKCWP